MLSSISSAVALTPLVLLAIMPQQTHAHTWIDCFDTDRAKIYDQSASYIFGGEGGNGFCQGYGAGYPGRGNVDIGTEYTYKMLKNEVEAGTPVCQNVGTDTYMNPAWRKRLSLTPGQTAYFAYLPNGHIVKDKKGVGTQHGVYWTGQVGTSLSTTLDMKAENLVDGHTMDYDDGNCGETVDYYGNPGGRAGDGKPCVGSFTIPVGTAPGIYHMVWYWTFWLDNETAYKDQQQAKGYFGAAYSTCFDVEVTSGTSGSVQGEAAPVVMAAAPTPAPVGTTAAPVVQSATTPAPMVTPVATAAPAVAATPAPTTLAPTVTDAPVVAATPSPTTLAPSTLAPVVTPAPTEPTPAPVVTPTPTEPTPAPEVPSVTPAPTTGTPETATAAPTPADSGKQTTRSCRRK